MATALNSHEWGTFLQESDAFSLKPFQKTRVDLVAIILARTKDKNDPVLTTIPRLHWSAVMVLWDELREHYGER